MNPNDFVDTSVGYLAPTVKDQRAFVPAPLPPTIDLTPVQQTLSEADQRLGELRGIGKYLPNPYLLIRPLQRREAIASSNIEGTFTSLPELLLLEAKVDDQHRRFDTLEVYNYIHALQHGVRALSEIPISNRLILQLHERLLRHLPSSRRAYYVPGEFRSDQNFIGKQRDINRARFIPPPPPIHLDCMASLERFIHAENFGGFPPLVYIALIHYQFETIHPFPDGNGRVGRLLIPLLLQERQIMSEPLLYMSQFFEDNKDEYVDLMLRVSMRGEWLPWIEFFLRGVIDASANTIDTIMKLRELQEEYMNRCQQARSSALLIQLVERLFETPIITIPEAKHLTATSYRAAKNNIDKLVRYGILREGRVGIRPKVFFASEVVQIFEQ